MILAVIFDFGRTLYNNDTGKLYPKAIPLLEKLKEKGLKMALVSRTSDPVQRREDIKRLNLEGYFQAIEVFPAHIAKEFDKVFKDLKISPENSLIVGDRIQSEIAEGNKAGGITVWIRQGKFSGEGPENDQERPSHTIYSLNEVLNILEEYAE